MIIIVVVVVVVVVIVLIAVAHRRETAHVGGLTVDYQKLML